MKTFKLTLLVKSLTVLMGLIIILALVACSSSSTTSSTSTTTSSSPPTSTSTSSSQPVTIDLTAQNMAFDKTTITVPAGAKVTINFTNKENIPHNFAAYTDSTAATTIFKGTVITNSSTTYTFTAPATPGTYFFRCDVHPTSMTGSFIVQ
jgi:plastocyanin